MKNGARNFVFLTGFLFVLIISPTGIHAQDTADKTATVTPMKPETMDDKMSAPFSDNEMSDATGTRENTAPYKDEDIVAEAEAYIEGTQTDSKLWGIVDLTETKDGVYVDAEFGDAPVGKHGFHVHEKGSCDEKGAAAGGHFNPDNVKHGYLPKDKHEGAHAGDMGNVEIDKNGDGYSSLFLPGASLTKGTYNLVGKAIIFHEKEDDFSQPTGNAGERIGCGVIEIVE